MEPVSCDYVSRDDFGTDVPLGEKFSVKYTLS